MWNIFAKGIRSLVCSAIVAGFLMDAVNANAQSSYKQMESYGQSLTDAQFDTWSKSFKGETVSWTGKIVDVDTKWFSSDLKVSVDMDNTGVQDVYFDVSKSVGMSLMKGQTISFRGRIYVVINTLGLFQVTLEDVTIR